jgi:nitroreductase/NAD-dependent dihydropyrimidine dehydrogenase PreA subunit
MFKTLKRDGLPLGHRWFNCSETLEVSKKESVNMEKRIEINREICSTCGLCAEICPHQIMKKAGEEGIVFRQDRLFLCMTCGQCMAICPSQAIVVEGLDYERDFFPLPTGAVEEMTFLDMIKTRRAIRAFKDKPVPRELLEKVVEAITFAPPGFTPVNTEIIVVQNTAVIRRALPDMIKLYDDLVRAVSNPVARLFVRRKAGREKFRALTHHVVPMMKARVPELKQGTEDTITRHAPAMIIFHAQRDAENYEEDVHIALTYGFLAAHALGLGGSAMTLVTAAIEKSPALRKLFSIPDGNVVAGSMILGYPKYRYQRSIRRNLKSVAWI